MPNISKSKFRLLNEVTCEQWLAGILCVSGALNEVWALLQKLLSMNYSNLVTAAFNYNTGAESSKKQREADREGMALWVLGKKKKQGFRG